MIGNSVGREGLCPRCMEVYPQIIASCCRKLKDDGTELICHIDATFRDGCRLCSVLFTALQANRIDWTIVQDWIKDCEKRHDKPNYELCCTPPALELPGFLVIDCITRKIVSARPHCRYAALSYIWGSNAGTSPKFCWTLPAYVPLVIEDAINCTQSLEIRYLWVDRYCIDQSESDTKHHQILNMDKIYGCATVTIIDAAGIDSNGGLPGVSITSRQPQKFFEVDGEQMITIPNTVAEIEGSKWWTRAWTFQEGLLSPRRIVFTRSQIYFQCLNMFCCESLYCKFKPMNITGSRYEGTQLQVFPPPIRAKESMNRHPGTDLNYLGIQSWATTQFEHHLKNYLARGPQLSYELDVVNAFMGILSKFSAPGSSSHHLWRMHFQSFTDQNKPKTYRFLAALLWFPERSSTCKALTKRPGFPSWTWAAWRGITDINVPRAYTFPLDGNFDVSVEINDMSGRRLNVHEYVYQVSLEMDAYRFQPWMHLTGWITTINIYGNDNHTFAKNIYADPGCQDQINARASILVNIATCYTFTNQSHSVVVSFPVFLYVERLDSFNHLDASKDTEFGRAVAGLILRPMGDRSYERVGVLYHTKIPKLIWLNDHEAYLEYDSWHKSTKLWCERRTIRLV